MRAQITQEDPPQEQELPPLPPEQEARIRAFVNMLLDVAEEKISDTIKGNHV